MNNTRGANCWVFSCTVVVQTTDQHKPSVSGQNLVDLEGVWPLESISVGGAVHDNCSSGLL